MMSIELALALYAAGGLVCAAGAMLRIFKIDPPKDMAESFAIVFLAISVFVAWPAFIVLWGAAMLVLKRSKGSRQ